MGLPCRVCEHPSREAIERDLILGSTPKLSRKWGVSADSLKRHRRDHCAGMLAAERGMHRERMVQSVLRNIENLHVRTLAILAKAEEKGDERLALAAIKEARENIGLVAKFAGLLGGDVNVVNLTSVSVDEPTAEKMARIYLSRHRETDEENETASGTGRE